MLLSSRNKNPRFPPVTLTRKVQIHQWLLWHVNILLLKIYILINWRFSDWDGQTIVSAIFHFEISMGIISKFSIAISVVNGPFLMVQLPITLPHPTITDGYHR